MSKYFQASRPVIGATFFGSTISPTATACTIVVAAAAILVVAATSRFLLHRGIRVFVRSLSSHPDPPPPHSSAIPPCHRMDYFHDPTPTLLPRTAACHTLAKPSAEPLLWNDVLYSVVSTWYTKTFVPIKSAMKPRSGLTVNWHAGQSKCVYIVHSCGFVLKVASTTSHI